VRRAAPLLGPAVALVAALAVAAVIHVAVRSGGRAAAPSPPPPVTAPPPPPSPAPAAGVIRYTVSFPAAAAHYVDVDAWFPADGDLELMMPVWTPGSYLVREYSKNVEGLIARTADGPLAVTRTRKNRWRIAAGAARQVDVHYRVYAAELGVRTSFVDPDFALLTGAATFVTALGGLDRAHEVQVELPAGWKRIATALPAHPDGAAGHFLAADYDTLIDSPLLIGNPEIHDIDVTPPHQLAVVGGGGVFDGAGVAAELAAVVRATIAVWGQVPYDHYWFLVLLADGGGGGLEHKASTVLHTGRWATRRRDDRRGFLSLCAHELFHAWNGKRLRPAALGPFDYENEVYTDDLWVVEGLTAYYDDLILARAGVLSQAGFLERLSGQIAALQDTPGRLVQPLAQASRDAWIGFYRPDENTANSEVNYYTKGALVGFLLDAEIRRRSGGKRSLDDALRLAYQRHAGARGYDSAELRAALADTAGAPLDDLLAAAVDGTAELDYAAALDWFGLRFAAPPPAGKEPAGFLGARVDGSQVAEVRRDTPAAQAGLSAGDELLAIDDLRLPAGGLAQRLERYRPGDTVELLVARRGQLRRLPVVLGQPPAPRWKLEPRPDAGPAQRARRDAWLGPDHPDQ